MGGCVCVRVGVNSSYLICFYVSLVPVLHSLDKFYWSFQLGITGSGTVKSWSASPKSDCPIYIILVVCVVLCLIKLH